MGSRSAPYFFMKMNEYDAIIAGGGPAGSTAGYLLSRAGRKTVIIDKRIFPRKKLCAGLITYKTIRLIERVFGETPDSLKQRGIINFGSDKFEVFYRQKSLALNHSVYPFYFIDRYLYDDFLLKKAEEAGADVITGEKVVSCDTSLCEVTTSSGKRLKGKFIIGADGINSVVRRHFPKERFNENLWTEELGIAREMLIERGAVKFDVTHPMIFFGFINYGYAWIFPNREKLVIGICGVRRKMKKEIAGSFNEFLSAIGLHELKNKRLEGYTLPMGNFIRHPVCGNVALVGDAAGFADPIFGEGIFYAQRSAELASEAIDIFLRNKKRFDDLYSEMLQKHIMTELVSAKRHRSFFYNPLSCYYLGAFFRNFGKESAETIHGIRSHMGLKKQRDLNF
ncbi:MAG: NAD(P)/FAD-dependent oxidoreductase [Nitrospirae bacterium]|nr:NAD(P)/FAD-dependent oxidoreductase [Nitrospirota bacterium]